MPIVGTAGHVDHGKSTLVLALTGRDPDRWDEEKERGLTIDLGFAWTDLGNGEPVGFVDVPGHERFIKNMLAGVGALDVAMLVIAADEGWMPQTEEHVAVIDLLEIEFGVIALTRVDLVDDDTADIAELEITEEVEGTTLAEWPIVRVSAPADTGLEALRGTLLRSLDEAGPPISTGRPRLWIDRAFTIAGAGAVVTGTLTGGSLAKGDVVDLWPGPQPARIRGIQSHEEEVDSISPGNRTALNLSGTDLASLSRGASVTQPGSLRATTKALVSLRTVRSVEEPLTDRGAYHIHIGSGSWPIDLRPVSTTAALVTLPEPIPLQVGDRYIVREVGMKAVVGGGRVLDPRPSGRLASLAAAAEALAAIPQASPDARAQALLEIRGTDALDHLAADSGGGRPVDGYVTDVEALSSGAGQQALAVAEDRVRAFQHENPLRDGIPTGELLAATGLTAGLLAAVLASSGTLVNDGATVRTQDFGGGWSSREQDQFDEAARVLTADLAVPRASQLGLDEELLHACIRTGRLVRVADDLVYLPEQIDQVINGLDGLDDGFTVAAFRDAYGLSRRHAVPLLEWLDAQGWTSRRGDARTVRRRR